MMNNLFVKTTFQKNWIEALVRDKETFMTGARSADETSQFATANLEKLIDNGYSALTLPKAYGGAGIGVYDMVLFQETLARLDAATALAIGWHLSSIGDIFETNLWRSSQLELLAEEVQKGALINRAATEAQTGSPTRGGRPETVAIKSNDYWHISGRKTFTTMAPMLSYFLTSAWIEDAQAIGFFLLHKDLRGLTIEDTWHVVSMRGTSSQDLILDNVKVDNTMLVEVRNAAEKKRENGWLLHIPACYLGIAQAARDYAVEFAKSYAPNSLNQTISNLPHIQQLIGEIDLSLIQMRHFLYSVAQAYDTPAEQQYLAETLGAVKYQVTNSAIEIVDKSMRIVGAQSLKESCPLQRYYRDVRAGLHNPPMDDAVIRRIALTAIADS